MCIHITTVLNLKNKYIKCRRCPNDIFPMALILASISPAFEASRSGAVVAGMQKSVPLSLTTSFLLPKVPHYHASWMS